jgi:hypothetical protein
MPRRIHLKFDAIAKLTAAIKPIEAAPPIDTPIAAPRFRARKDVAAEVRRLTRNEQRPQQLSDMSRTFYFAKAEPAKVTEADAAAAPVATPAAPPLQAVSPSPRLDERSLDLAFWNSVQSSNDCGSARAYLQRFPNGIFVDLAHLAERRLCMAGSPVTASPTGNSAPAAAVSGPEANSTPFFSSPIMYSRCCGSTTPICSAVALPLERIT